MSFRYKTIIGIAALLFFLMAGAVAAESSDEKKTTLRFGIAAMISPAETISTYRRILMYIEEKLNIQVQMVQRKSYAEMDELLKNKDVQIAMICSGPYVVDHEDFGVELLVAPVMYGKPFYHSYIITPKDSDISSMDGLRGKVFAFTDPKSNTGYIVPNYMLTKKGETPSDFFQEYVFSGHHSKSIEMVANKEADGAAIDHLVWEYMNRTNPRYTSKTKVIAKSPGYGMPPIVVHPEMDSYLKDEIKSILLEMHEDNTGQKLLNKIFIDRFIVPEESNYDTVREMILFLKDKQ